MIRTLTLAACLLACIPAAAETIPMGCLVRRLFCAPDSAGRESCDWGSGQGIVVFVELQKTGDGPGFEIWQGSEEGLLDGIYRSRVSIYQRREVARTFNFLTADLWINGVQVTSQGHDLAEVRYIQEVTKFGLGYRCTTDIEQQVATQGRADSASDRRLYH